MGAPCKNPPRDANTTIQELAAKGFSNIGIAKHFGVLKDTERRWLDEDEFLQEAFEMGIQPPYGVECVGRRFALEFI